MITEEFKQKSQQIIKKLKEQLASIRSNRPNSSLIEDIQVEYYGERMTIKQLASLSVTPPREINIQVWDKGAIMAIAKAIESSSLGLSVQADANTLRVHLPELSEERRNELIRYVKKETEQYKIDIRKARDEINKKIQKMHDDHEIGEDSKFKFKEEIQKETDKINSEIEKILENKIREINE